MLKMIFCNYSQGHSAGSLCSLVEKLKKVLEAETEDKENNESKSV